MNKTSYLKHNMPVLEEVVDELCSPRYLEQSAYPVMHRTPMPSLSDLEDMVLRLRSLLFPGFYGTASLHPESMRYHMQANLDSVFRNLAEQIRRGTCFAGCECPDDEEAREKAMQFIQRIPAIKDLLHNDVMAAYEGDPAAKSPGETIFCYPSILTMSHHRIAHELYRLKVPLIPRIISEMAHSRTGIDIHPGAQIGDSFFIDHGTGVVIGETCIIGKHCRIYQGVTLGALSFQKDEDGSLVKGIARHPILEDDVVVYANATILGRVTIGKGSIIGGNVWLTSDVPPRSKIVQQHSTAPAPDEEMLGHE
ncbi:MAG: serine acetyltransferase [Desulfovibrionaceae bacterium]|nr:serine acetyltransferase [Desulfovibrionaceae bacterium]